MEVSPVDCGAGCCGFNPRQPPLFGGLQNAGLFFFKSTSFSPEPQNAQTRLSESSQSTSRGFTGPPQLVQLVGSLTFVDRVKRGLFS